MRIFYRFAFLLIASAPSLIGCSTPYSRALDAANQAREQSRYVEALRHYETACAIKQDPNDEACKYAGVMRGPAQDQMLAQYGPICSQGEELQCIQGLAAAPTSIRENAPLVALREKGGKRYSERCRAAYSDDISGRVRRARCIGQVRQLVRTQAHEQRVNRVNIEAAHVLTDAARNISKGYPGARLILLDAAERYAPQTAARRDRDAARKQFLASSSAPLVVNGSVATPDGERRRDLCNWFKDQLGRRVSCEPGGVILTVNLRAARHHERSWTENHSQRYQAGTRSVENPAYGPAEDRVLAARTALNEAKADVKFMRGECDSARDEYNNTPYDRAKKRRRKKEKMDRTCNRYDSVRDIKRQRRSELSNAESDLSQTPTHLEEPVYDTHIWTSRHFEWTMPYNFTVEGLGTPMTDDSVIAIRKMEQPGFAPAGIQGVALGRRPTYQDMLGQATSKMFQAVETRLRTQMTQWAQERAAECPPTAPEWTGEWLQCHAEVYLWQGKDVDGTLLGALIK